MVEKVQKLNEKSNFSPLYYWTKAVETTKRKCTNVRLNNKKVKFQLDTGSDLIIINAETWKRINRLTLITSKNIARGVIGGKLESSGQIVTNVFFLGKEKIKINAFVMDQSQHIFDTDWMEAFDLFNVPLNMFCNYVDGSSINTEKLKTELKANFPEFFFGGSWIFFKSKSKIRTKRGCDINILTKKASTVCGIG